MKTRKRILSLLLCAVMIFGLMPTIALAKPASDVWDGSVATDFAGGTGTESDPYRIATGAQLAFLASIVNGGDGCKDKYFVLTGDINLNNKQWTPIGNTFANALLGASPYYCFAGNFDGNNYTISNLTIGTETSPLTADVCGLFGASTGTLKNINLNKVFINCVVAKMDNGYVIGGRGSLAGYASGHISNCTVSDLTMNTGVPSDGWVLANWVGGFVGILDEGASVSNCGVYGSINNSSETGSIGGFIGELGQAATISHCRAEVSVTEKTNGAAVGGFIGMGNGETDTATMINNCYAAGNVSGGGYSGGFAGNLNALHIKNCYATGNVSNSNYGASYVGSDGASALYYGSVTNCYATGTVSDIKVKEYAFAPQDGMQRSTFENCYYNNANTPDEKESTTAMSLEEMSADSFTDLLNNGDYSNGWIVQSDGTPYCGAELSDYSKVDTAIAQIPSDLSVYTDSTVQALNDAKNAVVRDKNITEQTIVDGYATAIGNAIKALKYRGADYSKVDAAIEKTNALNKDEYKNFSAVEAAIIAVVRDKNITEQTTVDGYATAIENAIAALEYKDADYSAVDEAISKANALNKDEYKDFSAVETAINAVVRDKNITEQVEVDTMAKAINDAVSALEKKSVSNPDKSATSDKTNVNKDKTGPMTGDNSNLTLWLAIMLASGVCLTGTAIFTRKKKSTK